MKKKASALPSFAIILIVLSFFFAGTLLLAPTSVEAKSKPTKAAREQAKSRHNKIKATQHMLKAKGYDPGPVDGYMGKQTVDALKAYQRDHSLTVDGRIGKETFRSLGLF